MKKLFPAFAIALLFAACNQSVQLTETTLVQDTVRTTEQFKYVSYYEGMLPCADCPGIRTRITFINDNLTYQRLDTYLEARDGKDYSYVSGGKYTTERGYEKDPDATVYVLDYDKPGEQAFLQVNDSTLEMLDRNRKQIKSTLNY